LRWKQAIDDEIASFDTRNTRRVGVSRCARLLKIQRFYTAGPMPACPAVYGPCPADLPGLLGKRRKTVVIGGNGTEWPKAASAAPSQWLSLNINCLGMVDRAGFEPAYALAGRFTVCCH